MGDTSRRAIGYSGTVRFVKFTNTLEVIDMNISIPVYHYYSLDNSGITEHYVEHLPTGELFGWKEYYESKAPIRCSNHLKTAQGELEEIRLGAITYWNEGAVAATGLL